MRRRRLPRALSRWFFSGFCFGLLFFLFFREKAVLSFLSGKEKKEPKKRNLIGEGDGRKPAGGPPPSYVSYFSLRGFSFRKAPQKYLRENRAPLTGGRSGTAQAGSRLSFLVLFSFSGKKREQIFPAVKPRAADGRAQRYCPGGFLAFFSGSLFFLRKERI